MSTIEKEQSPAPVKYRTAAQWLHDLGDVPLERIVFDPWPGTATEDDVIRLDDQEDRLCELVHGTLVEKAMGYVESIIAMRLGKLLLNFVDPRGLGVVAGEAGMMRLTRGLVRIPDVSFVSFARLPGGKVPSEPIPSLELDLAVEILSAGNTPGEMQRKLREYFNAGVRIVWIIDPATRSASVYRSPDEFTRIESGGVLRGEGVLAGFEISLKDLFADLPS